MTMDGKWTSGGYVGGVCHNLGKMTKVPSLLWRLIFLFGNFPSILIYLLLWVFMEYEYK
jgi:phage shock protein PspC (stress-responsive transcriptional regulator)